VIPDGVTDNDINQHPCSWQVADTIDAIRDRVIPQVAAAGGPAGQVGHRLHQVLEGGRGHQTTLPDSVITNAPVPIPRTASLGQRQEPRQLGQRRLTAPRP